MINKIEEQEKKEKASLFLQCEALFVDPDARKKIDELFEKEYQDFTKKVIVLDDDPTGIQTVHDVDVYTDCTKDHTGSYRDCRKCSRGRQRDGCQVFDDFTRGFHSSWTLSA